MAAEVALAVLSAELRLPHIRQLPGAVQFERVDRGDVLRRLALQRKSADHGLVAVRGRRVDEIGGIRDIESEVDHGRAATAAEIHRKIVDVDGIHESLEAQRAFPLVQRTADVNVQLEVVGELVIDVEGPLLESGHELIHQALGAHVDAIEQAVDHRALVVELDVADRHHRLAVVADVAAEGETEDVVVTALLLVTRHQAIQRNLRVLGGTPLQRQAAAGALGVLLGVHVARQAGMECAASGHQVTGGVTDRRVGHVVNRVESLEVAGARIDAAGGTRAAVGGGGAARARNRAGTRGGPADGRAEREVDGCRGSADVVSVGAEVEDIHRRVTCLAKVALLEGIRQQHAEGVVEEFLRREHRDARIHFLADFVPDAAAGEREHLVAVVIECTRRLEVHRGAQRAFLDVRRRRLAHGELREDLGGEHVEVEAAAVVARAVDVAGAGLCRAFHAVDAHVRELRAETANRDVAAFAAVAA